MNILTQRYIMIDKMGNILKKSSRTKKTKQTKMEEQKYYSIDIKEQISRCIITKNDCLHLSLSISDFQLFKNSVNLLIHLRTLDIGYNELHILPKSIGQLINLEILYLYDNELKSIPNSIGQLTKLKYLYLQNNQLEILPSSIGNLTNLYELKLFNNKLRSLPREIQQLTKLKKLRKLYISSNNFKTLPLYINYYYELAMSFENNPIKGYYLYKKFDYYYNQIITKILIYIQRMYRIYIFLFDFYSVY